MPSSRKDTPFSCPRLLTQENAAACDGRQRVRGEEERMRGGEEGVRVRRYRHTSGAAPAAGTATRERILQPHPGNIGISS